MLIYDSSPSLGNPDVTRVSFLPLLEPQPGEVYVVAIPYRKGGMDLHSWFMYLSLVTYITSWSFCALPYLLMLKFMYYVWLG